LIEVNCCYKNCSHYLTAARDERSNNLLISFSTSSLVVSILFLAKARITKSEPLGNFASCGATAWRTLRASVWRATDPPIALLTIKPHLGWSLFVTGEMYRYPTKFSVVTRVPLLVARAKSALTVKRAFLGSTRRFRCGSINYAERRVRPLARRAARTARPARVAMRARKPCFLARRRVLGW